MPVRGFIAWIFGNGKTLCEADTLSGGSLHERSWEKEAFTSCLLVLILTGKFIYPDAEASPSLELEPSSLGFQCGLKNQQPSRISLGLQRQIGIGETSCLVK